jgi:RNA polymerase sigma-70 factor (ECF subfamily)
MRACGEPQWDWTALRTRCLREARRFGASPADAEDAVQEALSRAWRMRDRCRNPADPVPWMLQITRREVPRLHGRATADPRPPEAFHATPALGGPWEDTALDRVAVRAALAVMSATDHTLIALRYGEDLTQPRVAEMLGLPEGTVKVRLHRVRAALRSLLDPHVSIQGRKIDENRA